MDVVADLRAAGRPAIDLTEDPGILTAIANDIGVEAIFSRQVIAYGAPGDVLLALSTSGNSVNVIDALAEARRRGLVTIAMVGYDGGRVAERGARGPRRRHPLRAHPADPGGPGERVPRARWSWRDERRLPAGARVRVTGTVQGVGFRPYVYRLAGELSLGGFVLNDAHGVLIEVEGSARCVDRFLGAAAVRGAAAGGGRAGAWPRTCSPSGERWRSRSARASAARVPDAPVTPDTRDLRRLPARAVRSRRPPLPLPVHQLHELRPAVHDRARRPVRPAADDDGAVHDVPGLPGRVRRPDRPPLPRPAERLPGLRALAPPARRRRDIAGDALAASPLALATGAIVAVKGIGGYHLACRAGRRASGGGAAVAQAPRGQAVRADGAVAGGGRIASRR